MPNGRRKLDIKQFDGGDEIYAQAVDVVARSGKPTPARISRELEIGYNTAAALVERMQSEGLVTARRTHDVPGQLTMAFRVKLWWRRLVGR